MGKTLFWDIETSPMELARFSLWHQGDHKAILRDSQIICIGYAFDDKKPEVLWIKDRERDGLEAFALLIQEAELLVHHNGNSFDWKVLNARMAHHGLRPPPPVLKYDTRNRAKALFRFTSNKLDYLGDFLGFGRKMEHEGLDLWLKVMKDDPKAIATMTKYCKRDVELLRNVYKRLSPYDPSHTAHKHGSELCTYCGSDHVQYQGTRRTAHRSYRRFQCQNCGKWGYEK